MNTCPHCDRPVFKKSAGGSKLKARTRVLVLHKSGEVEIPCDSCGKGILLPLRFAPEDGLRKAHPPPKLVVPKA